MLATSKPDVSRCGSREPLAEVMGYRRLYSQLRELKDSMGPIPVGPLRQPFLSGFLLKRPAPGKGRLIFFFWIPVAQWISTVFPFCLEVCPRSMVKLPAFLLAAGKRSTSQGERGADLAGKTTLLERKKICAVVGVQGQLFGEVINNLFRTSLGLGTFELNAYGPMKLWFRRWHSG